MMLAIRCLMIVTLAAVGCGGTKISGPKFTVAAAVEGTGLVYVYRPAKARRSLAANTLYLANRSSFVFNGGVAAFMLKPGTYKMIVGENADHTSSNSMGPPFGPFPYDFLPSNRDVDKATIDVTVVQGRATYVKVVAGDPPDVSIATEPDALPALADLVYGPGGMARYVEE